MSNIEEILQQQEAVPFGEYEEQAIISLILDNPEFFVNIISHLSQSLFVSPQSKYIITHILNYNEKFHVLPTRGILLDRIKKHLTVDDSNLDEILTLVARESDPREIPAIKSAILDWTKHKIINTIYSTEATNAVANKDYEKIYEILEKAKYVQDIGQKGLWLFEDYERLFTIEQSEMFTTGIDQLDAFLENPTRGEVLVYMAPTGVGKCHTLDSKIIEERLSRIYEIELENGKIIKLGGFREIQTSRGTVKVCDLTERDDITEIPIICDEGDLSL